MATHFMRRRELTRTTPVKPELVNLKEEKTVALCACKRSAGGPYCDGSHAKLESE